MACPAGGALEGKPVAAGKQRRSLCFEDWRALSLSLSLSLRRACTHTHTHTHTHRNRSTEKSIKTRQLHRERHLSPGHAPEGINTNTHVWNTQRWRFLQGLRDSSTHLHRHAEAHSEHSTKVCADASHSDLDLHICLSNYCCI